MARKDKFSLPTTEDECPHCGSQLLVARRWVTKPANDPPCPVCGKQFLPVDDGSSKDAITGRRYERTNVVECLPPQVLRRRKPPTTGDSPQA